MSNFLRRYQENTRLLNTLKIVADIAIIIVAAYVIILFTCYRTNISGNSMQPVLCNNDTVLINKFAYAYSSPKRYDVIAFKTSESAFDKIYIKRVIGVPGDKVLIKDGKVYINDKQLEDDVFTDYSLTAMACVTCPSCGGKNLAAIISPLTHISRIHDVFYDYPETHVHLFSDREGKDKNE